MDPRPVQVVVCEMTGVAWQVDTFRHEFRRIAKLAGIADTLQFRDLRATAVTEIADGGATVIEMGAHTGHLTESMARRYARRTQTQFNSAAKKRLAAREQGRDA